MLRTCLLFSALILFCGLPSPATAASPATGKYQKEEESIPKQPSAPEPLAPHGPVDSFRCQRSFLYKGQTITCDSNIRLDGEKLRPILSDVPEAVSELDLYQKNRLSVRSAAYIGTLGVVVMVVGHLLSQRYLSNGQPTDTSDSIRQISLIGGGAISAGGFIYGMSAIQTNDSHLENAVRAFNTKNPETPIQLQFSTGMNF